MEPDWRELFPHVFGIGHIHVSSDGKRMVWLRENPDRDQPPAFTEMVISDLGLRVPQKIVIDKVGLYFEAEGEDHVVEADESPHHGLVAGRFSGTPA